MARQPMPPNSHQRDRSVAPKVVSGYRRSCTARGFWDTVADRRRSGKTSTPGGLTDGHLKYHSNLHQLDGRNHGVDYNLASIGKDFPNYEHEQFDPTYMNALFNYGYLKGRSGYRWRKAPPILEAAVS